MASLIDRRILVSLHGKCEEAAQRALVAESRRQIERAKTEANPTGMRVFVDGREGAQIQSVRPFGTVHAEFYYTREVAQAALALLEETSPIDTGAYTEAHAVYLDGNRVSSLDGIETASRIIITNTVPYARVIERGLGKRTPWSTQPQVPKEGVYTAAARSLARRFGNVCNIRMGLYCHQ